MEVKHILVYGTLRKGQHACRAFGLEWKGEYVDTIRIEGSIYDLGSFPGVKLDGNPDGFVCDVFKIIDPDVLDALDAYEGYRPESPTNSLYLRQTIEVPDVGAAYIYEYNHDVSGYRIPSGDWLDRSNNAY